MTVLSAGGPAPATVQRRSSSTNLSSACAFISPTRSGTRDESPSPTPRGVLSMDVGVPLSVQPAIGTTRAPRARSSRPARRRGANATRAGRGDRASGPSSYAIEGEPLASAVPFESIEPIVMPARAGASVRRWKPHPILNLAHISDAFCGVVQDGLRLVILGEARPCGVDLAQG